jgi:REP element-mobilizing transposase RayT
MYSYFMSGLHKTYYRYTAYLKSPMNETFIPQEDLTAAWQTDGIRLHAFHLEQRRVQMVCESAATVTPIMIAQRLKGRLNHCLRGRYSDFPGFDRDFFLGTLGQNDRDIVTRYVQGQVDRSDLVDPLYRLRMKALRFHQDPGAPVHGKHRGIHDHFLHVVLVTQGRYRMFPPEAKKVADSLIEGSKDAGMDMLEFSIMPDHAHLMIRPDHHRSPDQSLDDLKSASAKILRRTRFWQNGGYTGSVGPYRMAVALQKTVSRGGWISP